MIDEVLHNLIHLILGQGLDSTVFHVLVPSSWLLNLHLSKPILKERIKLVFVKLSHRSKAGTLEEKVKILVVFSLLRPALFSSLLRMHLILHLLIIGGINWLTIDLGTVILLHHSLLQAIDLVFPQIQH